MKHGALARLEERSSSPATEPFKTKLAYSLPGLWFVHGALKHCSFQGKFSLVCTLVGMHKSARFIGGRGRDQRPC